MWRLQNAKLKSKVECLNASFIYSLCMQRSTCGQEKLAAEIKLKLVFSRSYSTKQLGLYLTHKGL